MNDGRLNQDQKIIIGEMLEINSAALRTFRLPPAVRCGGKSDFYHGLATIFNRREDITRVAND